MTMKVYVVECEARVTDSRMPSTVNRIVRVVALDVLSACQAAQKYFRTIHEGSGKTVEGFHIRTCAPYTTADGGHINVDVVFNG